MLAKNKTGYRNLLKLVTDAHLDGYYYRPRMDRELMRAARRRHHRALRLPVGRAAPPASSTAASTRRASDDRTGTASVFDGYYLEVQDTTTLPEFTPAEADASSSCRRRWASRSSPPTTRTTSTPDDHDSHDVLLCIGTNSNVIEEKRMKMPGARYYVRSEEEMRTALPRAARGRRQHLEDRRAVRPRARVRPPAPAGARAARRARRRDELPRAPVLGGPAPPHARRRRDG